MDILNRLKKDKKSDSVFDSVIKKKEKESTVEKVNQPSDMEVTHISGDKPAVQEKITPTVKEAGPKREFRTEGLKEFELDSLGVPDKNANLKSEYRAKMITLFDKGNYGEAIELLMELQLKLEEQSK